MMYDIPQQKQQAMAQNNNNNTAKIIPPNSVSTGITMVLLDDAIQALANNQTNKSLVRLNLAHENLAVASIKSGNTSIGNIISSSSSSTHTPALGLSPSGKAPQPANNTSPISSAAVSSIPTTTTSATSSNHTAGIAAAVNGIASQKTSTATAGLSFLGQNSQKEFDNENENDEEK